MERIIKRTGKVAALLAAIAIAAFSPAVASAETRTWTISQAARDKQQVSTRVTIDPGGEVEYHMHFSNGHKTHGARLTTMVSFYDADGTMLHYLEESHRLSPSRGRSTRTHDLVKSVRLAPDVAARVTTLRAQTVQHQSDKQFAFYIEVDSKGELKGLKWKLPKDPNAGPYDGISALQEMPRFNPVPPQVHPRNEGPRPFLDYAPPGYNIY